MALSKIKEVFDNLRIGATVLATVVGGIGAARATKYHLMDFLINKGVGPLAGTISTILGTGAGGAAGMVVAGAAVGGSLFGISKLIESLAKDKNQSNELKKDNNQELGMG